MAGQTPEHQHQMVSGFCVTSSNGPKKTAKKEMCQEKQLKHKTLQKPPLSSHKTVRGAKAKRDLVTLVDSVETIVLMGVIAADSTRNRSDRCCDNQQQQQRYTAQQVNTKVHSAASEHKGTQHSK